MKNATLIPAVKHLDLIYDVGMHRGEDAEFYLRKGFRCVAFEADPENISFCKKRLAPFIANGQLQIIEGAIIDPGALIAGQKTVKFYKHDTYSVLGTIFGDVAEQYQNPKASSNVLEVAIVNFTDAISQHGIPHYMKIDIEGCDWVCLNVLRMFKERPNYLSVEVDRTSFAKNQSVIKVLIDLGYKHFFVVEQSEGVPSQVAPFPAREGKYLDQRCEKDSSGLFGEDLTDSWKSPEETLRMCRSIQMAHKIANLLVWNNGIMTKWRFKGAKRLLAWTSALIRFFAKAPVYAWYDIHAKYDNEPKFRQ